LKKAKYYPYFLNISIWYANYLNSKYTAIFYVYLKIDVNTLMIPASELPTSELPASELPAS